MKHLFLFIFMLSSSTAVFSQIQIRDSKSKVTPTSNPLYVIDGKVYPSINFGKDSTQTMVSIESVKPSEIQSISILKDTAAVKKYGEAGKNGVVIITTIAFANKSKKQ